MINERDPNNSNRINVALTYTPIIPKIMINALNSFFIIVSEDFLDKINQTPSPEKIIRIEWKKKDCCKVVVVCSAIESVKGSIVVKNGLIAFRYLKVGKGKMFDSLPRINRNDAITTREIKKIKVFLNFCSFLLIFWINILVIRNTVGIISERPANPYTILGPGLSNVLEIKKNIIKIQK